MGERLSRIPPHPAQRRKERKMCKFCDGIAEWARTHCYRCDVPLTATGAEYQLCPGCLSVLGLGAQPTALEVYWQAWEARERLHRVCEAARLLHSSPGA